MVMQFILCHDSCESKKKKTEKKIKVILKKSEKINSYYSNGL